MDQTGNSSVISSIIDNNNENVQHASNSTNTNLDTSHNNNTNTTAPAPRNITFEFYLPLLDEMRIYYVTYTELNLIEIALRLNNRIDLSHIPDHQVPYHYSAQHLIRQKIGQQSVGYQQRQQSFDTMDVQLTSNNNASIPLTPVDYEQDTISQQSFDNIKFEFYLPYGVHIYHVTCTELNPTEIAQHLNTNRIDLSHHRLPNYCNVQHLNRQQIVQQPGNQQDTILQQPFDTMDIQPNLQEYSDNDAYDASSVPNSPEDTSGYFGHQNNQG